ncbi:MAG TPA: N-acetylglutaminylglutamine amidotransferase, partial [Guyparkeria sp.]|nr:N-acetylglutaminylglutamine amidotransferase [Guyparkeria sp.]
MSGICGWLETSKRDGNLTAVRRMMSRLERRGPDHEGSFSDGPLAFGHRRLAILDLSFRAHQPMVDRERGLAIVFNGSIYNHPTLREELQGLGHRFASTSDTETILGAFREWGPACVERLDGMFAFAIWDMQDESLFLARDRQGLKPLYHTVGDGPLRFASSVPALLAAGGIDTSFDPTALHHQFTLHAVVPAPRTIFRGVNKLPPGHWLRIDRDGKRQMQRYWAIDTNEDADVPADEWPEIIHQRLFEAVKKCLTVSDVPAGVLLSGGLDSSLIVALAHEAGVTPKTFTIGFEDQPEEKGSEFEYADPVAERYQTEHFRFHVPDEQVLTRLPEAVREMNEPMFGQDAVAFYLLAEQVASEVKLVLSGQGADELFGGYFWYPKMRDAKGSDLERFAPYYFDRSHEELMSMLTARFHGPDATSELVKKGLAGQGQETGPNMGQEMSQEIDPDKSQGSFANRVLGFDTSTLIVDDPIKRVDNMTMAWGLEARVPFLDTRLIETAMRIPADQKLAQGGKGVLKTIARGRIPDAVIDRPKGYFPVPALKFVRGPFLEFMREILASDTARARGLFEPAYVEKLLAEPDQHFTRLQGA